MNDKIQKLQDQIRLDLEIIPAINTKLSSNIMKKIFEYLHILDLFKCQLVCKNWYVNAKNMKLDQLEFISFPLNRLPSNFQINLSRFKIIESKLLASSFILNLKKLEIHTSDHPLNGLHFINQLNKMEELEINRLQLEESVTINLSNLKIFRIHKCNSFVKLNTPALIQFLTFDKLDQFEFVYPKIVEILTIWNFKKKVSQFSNLKVLIYFNGMLDERILAIANLKLIQRIMINHFLMKKF